MPSHSDRVRRSTPELAGPCAHVWEPIPREVGPHGAFLWYRCVGCNMTSFLPHELGGFIRSVFHVEHSKESSS